MKLKVHKTPAAIIDKMAIDAHNFNINSVKLHPITSRGPIIGNFLQKFSISIISICRRYASNLSIFSLSKGFWGGFGRDNFQNVPPKFRVISQSVPQEPLPRVSCSGSASASRLRSCVQARAGHPERLSRRIGEWHETSRGLRERAGPAE